MIATFPQLASTADFSSAKVLRFSWNCTLVNGCQWLENEVRLVTYIFACAAAILLEVLVSGANPDLPQIQEYVMKIVTILTGLLNHCLLLALSWPLCISGCMAKPIHYQFLIRLLSPLESTGQGGISNDLAVLLECWRWREKG